MKIIEVTNIKPPASTLYQQIASAEAETVTIELSKAELMALFCLAGKCCGSPTESIRRWTSKFYSGLNESNLFSKEFLELSRDTVTTPGSIKLIDIV